MDARKHPVRVIVVDEWLPWPLESGKKIRTYNLISRLARSFEIQLLAHARFPEDDEKRDVYEALGVKVHAVSDRRPARNSLPFYAMVARNSLSDRPFSTDYHVTRPLVERLRRTIDETRPDLVHIEWTNLAPLLDAVPPGLARVISSHNVESQIWRRLASNASNPAKRFIARQQADRLEQLERHWYPRASQCMAVSSEDQRVIRGYGASVTVVENGVDVAYYRRCADPSAAAAAAHPARLVYVASMDTFANRDAVDHFLTHVLPRVRARRPEVEFRVVGKEPPRALVELARDDPTLVVTGSVPDVRPHLADATVAVVPLRIGGGSRLKILEAMASGIPVVSTRIGAEGLALEDGADLILVDDDSRFAEEIVRLLADPALRERIARRALATVRARYDWSGLAERNADVWMACARQPVPES